MSWQQFNVSTDLIIFEHHQSQRRAVPGDQDRRPHRVFRLWSKGKLEVDKEEVGKRNIKVIALVVTHLRAAGKENCPIKVETIPIGFQLDGSDNQVVPEQ